MNLTNVTRNWKTTLSGVGILMTTFGNAVAQYTQGGFAAVNVSVLVAGLAAGIGFILAKDGSVTGVAPPVP